MKTQHTHGPPGPLRVSEDFSNNCFNVWSEDPDCEIFGRGLVGTFKKRSDAELFAASPELFEALRLMFEAFKGDEILETFIGGKKHSACLAARAAVAKATGN